MRLMLFVRRRRFSILFTLSPFPMSSIGISDLQYRGMPPQEEIFREWRYLPYADEAALSASVGISFALVYKNSIILKAIPRLIAPPRSVGAPLLVLPPIKERSPVSPLKYRDIAMALFVMLRTSIAFQKCKNGFGMLCNIWYNIHYHACQ